MAPAERQGAKPAKSICRQDLVLRDREDPLAPCRDLFHLPSGRLYFDGNSLGPLPRSVPGRLGDVVQKQWGETLIQSWNVHDWIHLPRRVGEKVAGLIGAQGHEVVMADSTSVNLYKLLAAALRLRPGRRVILADRGQFPTDLYMAQGLAELTGGAELEVVARDKLEESLDEQVAVLYLSHVDFKTGELLDMAKLNAAAHAAGALTLWDLSHSAGALPVDLGGAGADLAVGCGYKFLNGGPGAPSFLYVSSSLQESARSPLAGWLGHRDPFAFAPDYHPGVGIDRFQCGTPPILSLAALDAALEVFAGVDLAVVRQKSLALGDLFLERVEQRCRGLGLEVACPRNGAQRGSQISLRHVDGAAVSQALVERGVVGDFRVPDILRFGLTPLYMRWVDVWDAVEVLRQVLDSRFYDQPRFRQRTSVT